MKLEISHKLENSDVAALSDGLDAHSAGVAPPRLQQDLGVFCRENGRLVGGLSGATYWGWLHIKLLWIDKSKRGAGLGRQVIEMAEAEAIQRGCHAVLVDTMSFQAQDFYKKLGYCIFGELDDFPTGHQRIYLQKKLTLDRER